MLEIIVLRYGEQLPYGIIEAFGFRVAGDVGWWERLHKIRPVDCRDIDFILGRLRFRPIDIARS